MVDQLDQNVIMTEQRGQPVQLVGRRGRTGGGQRLADGALAAAGHDQPVPARLRTELLQVVAGPTLLITAQLGLSDRPGQPVVALDPAGQHQQMLPLRIGHPVLRHGQVQRQLRSVDGPQVVRRRGLGEPGGGVEAVVVGDGQSVQTQPYGLLDQLLRIVHPVQEAEVAVTVQFRVRHHRSARALHLLLIRAVGGPFVGVARRTVPLRVVHRPVPRRPPRHLAFQLAPGDIWIVPVHATLRHAQPPTEEELVDNAFPSTSDDEVGGSERDARAERLIISCLGPPLAVLHHHQPGAAVDADDLEPGDMAGSGLVPPQLVDRPGPGPGLDPHRG